MSRRAVELTVGPATGQVLELWGPDLVCGNATAAANRGARELNAALKRDIIDAQVCMSAEQPISVSTMEYVLRSHDIVVVGAKLRLTSSFVPPALAPFFPGAARTTRVPAPVLVGMYAFNPNYPSVLAYLCAKGFAGGSALPKLGIGSTLLNDYERYVREHYGVEQTFLASVPESVAFYTSRGYRPVTQRPTKTIVYYDVDDDGELRRERKRLFYGDDTMIDLEASDIDTLQLMTRRLVPLSLDD